MPNCIFCSEALNADTKPEHVLINALGGRNTTRTVDCSACNERFGGTIDKALAEQVAEVRNMLVLKSGSGKPPPALRRVQAGSDVITFNNDGTLEAVQKPFTIKDRPDGTKSIEIRANSLEDIARYVPHIAAALGWTEEQVLRNLAGAEGTMVTRRPGTVHFHFGFGGPESLRAIFKAALVLWATAVGNDEVASDAFAEARRFVLDGGEPFLRARMNLDSRYLPSLDEWKRRFGPFFNSIYIRSDANGRVVGHFTLYNIVAWHMVLAESSGTSNLKIALAVDPMTSAVVNDPVKLAEELDIPFTWLDAPDYPSDFVRVNERLNALVSFGQQSALSRNTKAMIQTVFGKHGIGATPTYPTDPNAMIGEIAQRFTRHVMNMPHEEKVSGKEIVEAVNAQRKKD